MIALNSRSRPRLSCRRWLEASENGEAANHDIAKPQRTLNVKKIKGGEQERQVLIGMITDSEVLAAVASKWPKRDGLFQSKWANLVGGWCCKHHARHGSAPGRSIENIFREWSDGREGDKDRVALVDRFLAGLSDEYERGPQSTSFLKEQAERHFRRVALERHVEQLQEDLERGDIDKAFEQVRSFDPTSISGHGLISSADITSEQIRWLWNGWIPLGELTVVDGNPGCGKSQLTLDVAARLSIGSRMPPHDREAGSSQRKPGSSIILSTEDSASKVIRPRLEALGADHRQIFMLGTDGQLPTFPMQLSWLEELITRHGAKLVVLDPFFGFLDGKVEANSDAKIRTALGPMALMAQRTDCAVVLIRHLNKKSDENVLYRGGGSIGVVGQCRSAIIVGRDPDNPTTRVMAMNKSNFGADPPSLAFEIEPVSKSGFETCRPSWIGEVDLSAGEVVVVAPKRKQGRPSQQAEIVEYIQALLEDGEMPSAQLQERVMEKFGVGKDTFAAARKKAGVKSRQKGFRGPHMAFIP